MPFSEHELVVRASKLSMQILGLANQTPGEQFDYNEHLPWVPVIPSNKVWASFSTIPGALTPAQADNAVASFPDILMKQKIRLTLKIETNDRAYLARTTYGDHSTPLLENGIQPSLIQYQGGPSNGYAARLFHGDPDAGGVALNSSYLAGIDGAPSWGFNYPLGVLLVSTDHRLDFRTLYNTNGVWVVWYRYIGAFGFLAASGRMERNFSHSDFVGGSLAVGTIPANSRVESTVIIVSAPFNGGTATVGDAVAEGRLMTAVENNLLYLDSYKAEKDVLYGGLTSLSIYFAGAPTQGAGTVLLYYTI